MLLLKNRSFLGHYGQFVKLQQKQQLRLLANEASRTSTSGIEETDFQKEWAQAKPFSSIPYESRTAMIMKFLPGGKYSKLDASQLMLAIKNELGDICLLKGMFGKKGFVCTFNPKDFEQVLRNEGIWPIRPGMEFLEYYRSVLKKDFYQGTEGLLSTHGEKWGNFRSVVNPIMMQPKTVRLYMSKMSQINKELMARIRELRNPETLEVPDTFKEELNRWALESVSVVALDKQLGLLTVKRSDPTVKTLFQSLTDFFTLGFEMEFKPSIWRYYQTKTFKKLLIALDNIQSITTNYVQEALERIEEQKRQGLPDKPESEKSVLEKLVKIDSKIAQVMAMDMLMAGVDTTTTTFTGLLLCLAKNPTKQSKLREEILRILPAKDSEFREDALKNIPYLRGCIKESQRFYPVGAGNVRVNQKDVVLSGYKVPAGTQCLMINTSLNMDETYYPRAKEYLPERWLRPEQCDDVSLRGLKPNNPFVFLPFGFGPRSCIGKRIVEMELELGIARLVRNFYVEFNYPTENAFKSLQINVPNIPLKFKFSDVEN